jgi:PKD repeat protein
MKKLLPILFTVFSVVTAKSQTTYTMCYGTQTTQAATGTLYDSGGPNYSYYYNEYCAFLIKASCAGNPITLSFSSFQTEGCCDYLYIYNGNNTSAPVIGMFSGSSLPSPVTATSGSMLLVWSSDGSVNYGGWSAYWNSNGGGCPPVSNFTYTSNSCQGTVNFTDQSQNTPTSWLWNFGDGAGASTLKNPSYTYTAPGTYSVTLIATNAAGNSTSTRTVQVNPILFNIGYNGLRWLNTPISFTTNNTSGSVYTWNFGDGGFGGTANAIHSYSAFGTYTVSLTIASGSCVTSQSTTISITDAAGIHEVGNAMVRPSFTPNPFKGSTTMRFTLQEAGKVRIEVINSLGQLLQVKEDADLSAGEYSYELSDIPPGLHYVKIRQGDSQGAFKVISEK